ncbi:MAG TPA: DUF4118 domain-containing protein [bacterium]|nr:DUF4118 domain-containing protein [bacterium]
MDKGASVPGRSPSASRVLGGYALAAALVGAATALALPARGRIDLSEIVMIYLMAIVVVAARTSRGPAFFAAVLSVALFDFLSVPPYYTFAVNDARYLPTFAVMLVVGLVIGTLTTRAREQAEAAAAATLRARTEELRSTLLRSISHDLRTPLAAVKGAATALLDGETLDENARLELLGTIQEEAERLERLVTNLLDMTRLESGGLNVRKEWVPLEEIAGSAMRRLERKLAGREVLTDLPAAALVPLDDVLMENVLANVLENATRHTPAGSPIEIRAHVSEAEAVIEISDRGPGLPVGSEEKIFEKFWQTPDGRRHGGVGLGLPISRGIVEAHGGEMTASNRAGGGTTFRIVLPVGAAQPQAPSERREVA